MKPFLGQSVTEAENSAVSHNATCDLTVNQAPVLNGVRLRMTPDQVLALFPDSNNDPQVQSSLSRPPSQFGQSSFVIKPAKYKSKDRYSGISQIIFTLLDGRVSTLSVGYNGPQWSHVDRFVAKFTEGTNLPAEDQWEAYVGMDTQLKTLRCTDFEVRVFAGGQGGNLNYVLMTDLEADKKLKDRRKKARERAALENKAGQ